MKGQALLKRKENMKGQALLKLARPLALLKRTETLPEAGAAAGTGDGGSVVFAPRARVEARSLAHAAMNQHKLLIPFNFK